MISSCWNILYQNYQYASNLPRPAKPFTVECTRIVWRSVETEKKIEELSLINRLKLFWQKEWLKTEDSDTNYLITDNVINSKMHSYNSKDSLMNFKEADKFLKETSVIN